MQNAYRTPPSRKSPSTISRTGKQFVRKPAIMMSFTKKKPEHHHTNPSDSELQNATNSHLNQKQVERVRYISPGKTSFLMNEQTSIVSERFNMSTLLSGSNDMSRLSNNTMVDGDGSTDMSRISGLSGVSSISCLKQQTPTINYPYIKRCVSPGPSMGFNNSNVASCRDLELGKSPSSSSVLSGSASKTNNRSGVLAMGTTVKNNGLKKSNIKNYNILSEEQQIQTQKDCIKEVNRAQTEQIKGLCGHLNDMEDGDESSIAFDEKSLGGEIVNYGGFFHFDSSKNGEGNQEKNDDQMVLQGEIQRLKRDNVKLEQRICQKNREIVELKQKHQNEIVELSQTIKNYKKDLETEKAQTKQGIDHLAEAQRKNKIFCEKLNGTILQLQKANKELKMYKAKYTKSNPGVGVQSNNTENLDHGVNNKGYRKSCGRNRCANGGGQNHRTDEILYSGNGNEKIFCTGLRDTRKSNKQIPLSPRNKIEESNHSSAFNNNGVSQSREQVPKSFGQLKKMKSAANLMNDRTSRDGGNRRKKSGLHESNLNNSRHKVLVTCSSESRISIRSQQQSQQTPQQQNSLAPSLMIQEDKYLSELKGEIEKLSTDIRYKDIEILTLKRVKCEYEKDMEAFSKVKRINKKLLSRVDYLTRRIDAMEDSDDDQLDVGSGDLERENVSKRQLAGKKPSVPSGMSNPLQKNESTLCKEFRTPESASHSHLKDCPTPKQDDQEIEIHFDFELSPEKSYPQSFSDGVKSANRGTQQYPGSQTDQSGGVFISNFNELGSSQGSDLFEITL